MIRQSVRIALVVAACAATTTVAPAASQADPVIVLNGSGPKPIPLKNAAMISTTEDGYRYRAGQQDSHLTVSMRDGKLLYVDTGTQDLRDIPRTCTEVQVAKGISALCSLPQAFVNADEMFLEIWPRLGDDYVNGATLPAKFRMWVLADKGHDTVIGGAGDDFVNGAQDNDRAWGGAGDDWIRTGIGNDELWGDEGNDKLVGVDGSDEIHGGDGNDRVGGGPSADFLYGDAGRDQMMCGSGSDNAWTDEFDRLDGCERVERAS